jgi:autotransporter-associated beta strand protein
MNTRKRRLFAISASVLFCSTTAFAQSSGTWNTLATPASWATAGNWAGNQIASGANQTADFSTLNPTVNTTVNLDGARTIGNLVFGDTDTSSVATWFLLNGTGGSLEIAGTFPTITVNALGASRFANIQATLSGSSGFTKTGVGVLLLNQPLNTITGPITLNQGNIQLNSASLTSATSVTLNAGSLIIATSSANAVGGTINFAGGSLNFNNNPGTDYSTQFSTAAGQVYRINSITGAGTVTMGANLTSSGGSFIKGNTGTIVLTGANNSFTGGTTVNQGTLSTGATGSFGSGDVTVAAGAFITAGNADSFFDDGELAFSSTSGASSINLNYLGVDTIGSVFDIVNNTSLTAGTYNASQLNTFFGSSVFTGTGSLLVAAAIPEPSAFAALVGLAALGLTATRRRRT